MIYFISDVHLGVLDRETDKKREDLLLQLLDKISLDAEKIYLVGDIFDYWFDYKTVIPKYFYRTLTKLYYIKKNVCDIEFLMGNHDFGHYDFFEKELDIRVHHSDIERVHHGKKFYLSHGDGKNPKDIGYLALKKIMRNKFSLWLYLKFHPNFGIWLASGSSKKSRKYTSQKQFGDTDTLFEFAKIKIDEGFDYVLMGHRHRAAIIPYKNGKFINIGEWILYPTIVAFNNNDIYHINVNDFLKIPD
jgi:UDP-2,3-diacylglucosamine hydrolase